jgi:hypothetical protein
MNIKIIGGTVVGVLVLAGISSAMSGGTETYPQTPPNIQVNMVTPEEPTEQASSVEPVDEAAVIAQQVDRSIVGRNAQIAALRETIARETDAMICQRATEFFNQSDAAMQQDGTAREVFLLTKFEQIAAQYEDAADRHGVFTGNAEDQAVIRPLLIDLSAASMALEKLWLQDTASCPNLDNWATIDQADRTINSAKRVRSRGDEI